MLLFSLAACSGNNTATSGRKRISAPSSNATETSSARSELSEITEETENSSEPSEEPISETGGTLIAYFS